ncbi:MAG: hypothetical protein RIF32_20725, partial [Leptospirales bacterium]
MKGSRIFSSGPFAGLQTEPRSAGLSGATAAPARVLEAHNKKLRADVQTTTGLVYRDVEFAAALIDREGRAHGRVSGLQKGQVVWVDFAYGNPGTPVITAVLSGYEKRDHFKSIRRFFQKLTGFDPDEEYGDFHRSGYGQVFKEDRLAYLNKDGDEVFAIDFQKKEVVLKKGFRLRVEGASPADSSLVTGTMVTTPGYISAVGGVSLQTGVPAIPGVILAQRAIVAEDLAAADLVAGTVNAGEING